MFRQCVICYTTVCKNRQIKSLHVNSLNLQVPIADSNRLSLIHWFRAWFIAIYNDILNCTKWLAVSPIYIYLYK